MSVLTVKDLKFKYPGASSLAVDGVSFNIEEGSYTAVVGFNGSGKSTIARLLCGLAEPLSGTIEASSATRIGIVFQSPQNQIVSSIVYRDTSFGPQSLGMPASEVELRSIECLNIVDLLSHAKSGTTELSLGQVQKTALAGMLAIEPDVLILDEALSMIDPHTRSEIFEFLKYWNSKGKTIIHITHDYEAVLEAKSVIGINEGKVFYDGDAAEFLKSKENQLRLCGEKSTKKNKTALVKAKDKETSLRVSDLSFSYNQDYGVHNISFDLYKGTITALTGTSGAGKSTILELCAGLIPGYTGKIYSKERPVLAQQNASSALFEAFACDDVAFGPRNQGKSGSELVELVKDSMAVAGLDFETYKEKHTFELSGGQQRCLSIAGIIALNSSVLLFDEPTAGLDSQAKAKVLEMFKNLAQQGKTILFSTHHQDEIDFADREIQIESGRLVKDTCSVGEKAFVPPSDTQDVLSEKTAFEAAGMIAGLRKAVAGMNNSKGAKSNLLLKVPSPLRIIIFLVLFVLTLVFRSPLLCGGMFIIGLIYAKLSGFAFKKLLSSFLKITPFLMFFALLQLIFKAPLPDEVRFTTWKFFTITPSKLWFCLSSLLRTYASIACICAFIISTPEYDLIDGLKLLLWPLEKIKIPVRYLILIIEIIFRFIPLLVEEASSIIKTQTLRGSMGKAHGTMGKIKAIIPLLVPIIIQTIKRSEALADAITMRGF